MSKQLLNFKGVYGEQTPPFWDSAVYIEPIKKRSQVYNFEINEHLHSDLVQIFILEGGRGTLLSEGRSIDLVTPCIAIIPNGVLHGFSWEPDIKGTVITYALPYFESCLQQNINILIQFQQLQHLAFQKGDIQFEEIVHLKNSLSRELEDANVDKHQAIQLIVNIMLLKLYRKNMEGAQRDPTKDNRSWIYFNSFQKEITQEIDSRRRIKDYAQALNITAVHLNRICQGLVKKSALQIVHEKLVTEAKKHLLYTSMTISEVSYKLNFKDPSHFSKFFKKMVGVGPRQFRNSQDGYVV